MCTGALLRRLSLLFLVLIAAPRSAESLHFNGSTYISYPNARVRRALPKSILKIPFRTIQPSGLLFHAAGDGGDFITLELLRGKIRYSISMGRMQNVSTYRQSYLGKDLADNDWHQVEVKQKDNRTVILYLDIVKEEIEVPRFYSKLLSHQKFYFGGVNDAGNERARYRPQEVPFTNFTGCFDDIYTEFNGLMLHDLVRNGNATVHGKPDVVCKEESGYYPVTFEKPESFLKIQDAPERDTAEYSFKFRTYNEVGLLLFQTIKKTHGANIFISLESGRVKLEVEFMSKSTRVTLHGGSALYDGMWHSVSVTVSIPSVTLKVDKEVSSQSHIFISSTERFISSSEVFVGARDRKRPGFVGCMRDLSIQGRLINFTTVYKSQVATGECSLLDLCVPSPCKNGGRCTQLWNRTTCDCSGTHFRGSKCEIAAFFMQTCTDWWRDGKRRNGYYKINPGRSEPFLVYCNMSDTAGPSTVISHTQVSNPTTASRGKLVDRKFYLHEIYYDLPEMTNIRATIASSTHCRQYLRYSCYNSVLFDSPNEFKVSLGRGARWVSRDGHIQDYWSGASPGSSKCACGVNRTCVEPNKVCNCDTVSTKWRMDDGYLTDPRTLPVSKMLFSVNGTSSRSFFILGSLECFGSTTKRPTQSTTTTTGVLETSTTRPSTKRTSTSSKHTNHETKSPSTSTSGHPPTTDKKKFSTTTAFPVSLERRSTRTVPTKTSSAAEVSSPGSKTVPTTRTSTDDDLPPIVVIESPKRYITIRENANQELVLIILSIILAVFVIAIVVLIVKQNLFFPCKCLQTPLYQDVHRIDNIELGPPSPIYGEAEPEILQFEASPYPARNYDVGSRISLSPELFSDAETDRLDISNGSSSWNSENADMEKEESEKQSPYKDVDLGLIDVVPFTLSKQLSTDQQIEKLKEVIFDVLSASDVISNHGEKRETTPNKLTSLQSDANQKNDSNASVHFQPAVVADEMFVAADQKFLTDELSFASDNGSMATVSELSAESELSLSANSWKNYTCDEGTDLEKELDEESPNDGTLETRKPIRRNATHGNWMSSDPHNNYLSLDLDQLEDGSDTTLEMRETNPRSPHKDPAPDRQSLRERNSKYPRNEQRYLQPTCDETNRDTRSRREDNKRKPRSRLFSRQRSEEEALLSSRGLNQDRQNRLPGSNRNRYSGISNAYCHMRQNDALRNNSKEQLRDDENDKTKILPLPPKQKSHAQKYETEL